MEQTIAELKSLVERLISENKALKASRDDQFNLGLQFGFVRTKFGTFNTETYQVLYKIFSESYVEENGEHFFLDFNMYCLKSGLSENGINTLVGKLMKLRDKKGEPVFSVLGNGSLSSKWSFAELFNLS